MKTGKQINAKSNTLPTGMIVALVAFALVVLYVLVSGVITGPGTTESKAAQYSVLTPGDDGLSLQQDLEILSQDETVGQEEYLDAAY